MPNPLSIAIADLTANAAANQPAAQAIDTDGIVPIAAGGRTDRLILEIVNVAAVALTVKVKAGDNPPAHRAGVGDLSVAMAATGTATDKRIIGPFESGRFIQDDGTVSVSFTAASATPNATVRCYRLPKSV